jgi:hypothetical protein
VASPPPTARVKRKRASRSLVAGTGSEAPKPQPSTIDAEQCGLIAALALLIAGAPPWPNWLMPGLGRAVSGIAWAKKKQDEYPRRNRNAQRVEWQRRRDECQHLLVMLDDYPAILALTDACGFDDLGGQIDARQGLLALTEQLDAAIANTREGKGRHKFYTGTSPQLACAIYVVEAWREVHGEFPPHTSERVHHACALLWELTGLPRVHFGDTEKGWREHLRKAKQELQAGHYPTQRNTLLGPDSY